MKKLFLLIPFIVFFSCKNNNDSPYSAINVTLFPNPCTYFLNISGNLRTQNEINIKLSGSDIEKSLQPQSNGFFDTVLNLESLKPGSYNLQIFDGKKEVYNNIIINQKTN
jgi:hypothetical protein